MDILEALGQPVPLALIAAGIVLTVLLGDWAERRRFQKWKDDRVKECLKHLDQDEG